MTTNALRRILLATGVVVLLLLAWLLGRQQGGSALPPPQPSPPSSSPTAAEPTSAATTPEQPQPAQQGALAAAAAMVTQLGSPQILTERGRKALSERVAEPGRQTALEQSLALEAASPVMVALRDDDERGLAYGLRTVPVDLRLDSFSQSRAQVAAFTAVYVASTSQPAVLGHGIVTVELVWSEGAWRLRSYRNAPAVGPAPAGYAAPADGWRPISGESVIALSYELRQMLSQGSAPPYGLP